MGKEVIEAINRFVRDKNGYEANVSNFIKYIQEEKELLLTDTVLGGIDTDDIIASIDFCIKNCGFSTKSIARKYSVAIAQLFTILIVNEDIKNKDFYEELRASSIEDKSYYSRINEYINSHSELAKSETIDTVTNDEVDLLIDLTSLEIENTDVHNTAKGFERLSALLGIKVMLLTGIKYNVLRKIKREDINISSAFLIINGLKIRLPIVLCSQLNYLLSLNIKNKPKYLFVNFNGTQWGEKTQDSKITYVVFKYFGKSDTTGLTKYGISNLIKAGVNDSIIKKLTSANDTIIKDCLENSVESEPLFWEKYINSKLSNVDIYYKL